MSFSKEANLTKAQVVIAMGSDSDWPTMSEAANVLTELGVVHEVHVVSAHRTPERATQLAKGAAGRGIQVIIAGAGGAAHLAGVLAAGTTIPVVGVPLASSPLAGFDALLATAQMPPGVPVATVAVGGARNAGILAAQIVAVGSKALAERVRDQRHALSQKVDKANKALQARLAKG